LRSAPLKLEVVSAVGAGDSFLGGMMAALAAGEDWEGAFRMAVAAGSAAVMRPGTELCSEDDVRRLLGEVKISEIEHASA
jgi:6-phosphofructokinase 2